MTLQLPGGPFSAPATNTVGRGAPPASPNHDEEGPQLFPETEKLETICRLYASQLARLSTQALARARELGVHAEYVDYIEVLLRDGLNCHLCRGEITAGPGRQSGSLSFDHLKALNRGGEHVYENVKPAHLSCNCRKRDRER